MKINFLKIPKNGFGGKAQQNDLSDPVDNTNDFSDNRLSGQYVQRRQQRRESAPVRDNYNTYEHPEQQIRTTNAPADNINDNDDRASSAYMTRRQSRREKTRTEQRENQYYDENYSVNSYEHEYRERQKDNEPIEYSNNNDDRASSAYMTRRQSRRTSTRIEQRNNGCYNNAAIPDNYTIRNSDVKVEQNNRNYEYDNEQDVGDNNRLSNAPMRRRNLDVRQNENRGRTSSVDIDDNNRMSSPTVLRRRR